MMDTDRGVRTAVIETAPTQDRTEELQCFTAVPAAVILDSNPEFRLQTATAHIARNIRCLCIGVLATPFYRFLARFSGRRRKNEPKSKQSCCSSNINNNKNNIIITNEPISTISNPTTTTKVTSSIHTNSNSYNKTNLLSTFRHSSHCPSSLESLPSPATRSSSSTCSSVLSSTSSTTTTTTTTSSQSTTSVISRSSSSSSLSPSTLLHHLLPLPPTWLWLALFASTLLSIADACSSRATPKPRPPAPTARPNVTFHTYTCPPAYAAWYCLNGATCFTVKIGDELLYNCECADGFMGPRCEYKDLDGSYLPSQRRYMLETASIAGGATIAVFLVFIVCIAAYIRVQRRAKARIAMGAAPASGDCVDSPVTYARAAPRRVFGNPPWRGTRDMYTVPMENLSVTTAENPRECVTTQSGIHWNEQQAASQQVPSSAPP